MSDDAIREVRRRLKTAQVQLRKAVDRWQRNAHAGVDFRHGHRVEAARLAREVRDAADDLLRPLSKEEE